jgi:hypothetical protein
LSVTIGNLVLVANAGVQNSAVTKFIASNRFRCDCVSNVSFVKFSALTSQNDVR